MVDDLRGAELENIDFGIEVYGDIKAGTMDSVHLGDLLRICGLNPSLGDLEKLGVQPKPGGKIMTKEEIIAAYAKSKKDKKEQGCYEDFIECLKLYDKNENGKMVLAELSHSLLTLGEKLTDAQVDEVFEDCLPEEDDDGEIEYDPFLRAMCNRPKPE